MLPCYYFFQKSKKKKKKDKKDKKKERREKRKSEYEIAEGITTPSKEQVPPSQAVTPAAYKLPVSQAWEFHPEKLFPWTQQKLYLFML